MKTVKLTFKSDFHNTRATIRAKVVDEDKIEINSGQWDSVGRKLCGMKDCSCEGIRGTQEQEIEFIKIGLYRLVSEERKAARLKALQEFWA